MDAEFVDCPEIGCGLPAEVLDRFVLDSTDGPVEHFKIRCVRLHWFMYPGPPAGVGA